MRRLLPLAALALPLIAGGCGKSNCQQLLERICSCSGASSQSCTTTIEDELKAVNPSADQQTICGEKLQSCNASNFCEWILTAQAKEACGLSPDYLGTTVP